MLFSVVAAAVIGMQLYVKRGMQAKIKNVSDFYTSQGGTVTGMTGTVSKMSQYEPYYTADSNYNVAKSSQGHEAVAAGFKTTKTMVHDTTTRTKGGYSTQGVDFTKENKWKTYTP